MLFKELVPALPAVEFGAHLHTTPAHYKDKLAAAFESGCKRFDGAIKGFGGCPMATDELTGNMPTELMLKYFVEKEVNTGLDDLAFDRAMHVASEIFPG
jgi:hydroxymethylglutaryl-CoA lyase